MVKIKMSKIILIWSRVRLDKDKDGYKLRDDCLD